MMKVRRPISVLVRRLSLPVGAVSLYKRFDPLQGRAPGTPDAGEPILHHPTMNA